MEQNFFHSFLSLWPLLLQFSRWDNHKNSTKNAPKKVLRSSHFCISRNKIKTLKKIIITKIEKTQKKNCTKIQTILHLYFLMRSNFMIHALQNSVLRPGVTTSIKVALKKQLCFSHAQFIQSIVVGPCNIFYVSVKTECSAELTSWDF